jgi:hypothetical protein
MGWLSDNFDFEMFNLKDMWEKIEDNPFQLITGVDPFSTGMWNTILNRDDEPIVNQLGGPYGGSSKMGLGSGGVYDRAQEAGIDIGPATQMHDIAEVVASYYAMKGLGGIGGEGAAAGAGGGGGAAGGGGATTFALPETGSLGGGEFINAAGEPIAGGAGGGGFWDSINPFGEGGQFDFQNMGWEDYMKMGQQFGGGMGEQQQQQQAPGMRPMPAGRSGYQPWDVGSPEVYSPPRSIPFGLLQEEDELEKLQKILGGIL